MPEPLRTADLYYESREDGRWVVRGPTGVVLSVPTLDVNVARVIALLLSGRGDDALLLLGTLAAPGRRVF
jgi:hypothetical protein